MKLPITIYMMSASQLNGLIKKEMEFFIQENIYIREILSAGQTETSAILQRQRSQKAEIQFKMQILDQTVTQLVSYTVGSAGSIINL